MTALALLLGATAGAGVAIAVLAVRGRAAVGARTVRTARREDRRRAAVAAVAGIVVLAVTGWPVLGLLVAGAVLVVPRLLDGSPHRRAAGRTEAVAQWIEMLRDTMAGAAGLEEAILVSARRPPPPIAPDARRLARRLQHHALPEALRRFAVELQDPAADLLAAALITAATNETRDLGRVLAALVEASRAQVQMRESIDAGRAHVRSATRLVLTVTAVFTLALVVFSRDYLAPYGTVEGQLWLAVVGGVVATSLALLLRLDRVVMPATPLVVDPATSADIDTPTWAS